jgi:hypothetical protein
VPVSNPVPQNSQAPGGFSSLALHPQDLQQVHPVVVNPPTESGQDQAPEVSQEVIDSSTGDVGATSQPVEDVPSTSSRISTHSRSPTPSQSCHSTPGSPSPTRKEKGKKRVRISNRHSPYGFVSGVMQGASSTRNAFIGRWVPSLIFSLEIPRHAPARERETNIRDAKKRFQDQISNIVSRVRFSLFSPYRLGLLIWVSVSDLAMRLDAGYLLQLSSPLALLPCPIPQID